MEETQVIKGYIEKALNDLDVLPRPDYHVFSLDDGCIVINLPVNPNSNRFQKTIANEISDHIQGNGYHCIVQDCTI